MSKPLIFFFDLVTQNVAANTRINNNAENASP